MYFIIYFLWVCSTAPTLSAIFFISALDTAKTKKEIRKLDERARDMSLTLNEYEKSQQCIEGINNHFSPRMIGLTVVALYNAVGYLVILFHTDRGEDDDEDDDKSESGIILYDTFKFAQLCKEACLFLGFVYLAMVVNDAADDVWTEVYLWPSTATSIEEGEGGMEAGAKDALADRLQRKFQIIAQATTVAGPKQREYRGTSWRRLAANKAGGIGVRVLGVRWTSSAVLALLLSFGTSTFTGYARKLAY